MEDKFYNKSWFMWLTLVFFAPVGIFLLWKSKRFNKNARVIISAISAFIFIIAIVPKSQNSTTTTDKPTNSNKVAVAEDKTKDKPAADTKKDTGKPKEPAKKATMESLVSDILSDVKIKKEIGDLSIQYKIKDNLTMNMMIEKALFDIKDSLKALQSNGDFKSNTVIKFEGMIDVTDQYGNNSTAVGLENTFDQSEIQKVKDFDNITLEQLIALQGKYRTGCSGVIRKDLSDKTIELLYPNN